ncbi:MarR family winged helix-turn-helix transcriptional regulator [Lentilactobacillus raoultii]|uniref:MarR family winged helix-turn-helix transcriptional regulator n=1 Tax=Lentilactobacillus raoultii TaxID=1987503 RepID=A0ABW3PJ39_9LACO|nr:transcriptional regulator [Lentilactobacillus raoultii]
MNDVETNQIGRYISIIQRSSITALNHQLDLKGLTASNANLLLFIRDYQKVTAQMVANQLSINKGLVSREFATLEKNGYIQRETDQNDRRNTWVTLTDQGQHACRRVNKLMAAWWRKQFRQAGIKKQSMLYRELNCLASSIVGEPLDYRKE